MANLASDMSLSELAERCRSEMIHYSLKEAYDDLFCLEIFRRAMLLVQPRGSSAGV